MSQDHRNQADWLAEASFLALAVDLYYLGGTEPYFDEDVSKSRALFENLFESSPDAIVEANREGLIVRINAQVESMFGYTRGELIGQPVNILVPERFRAAHITHQQSYHAAPHTRPMGVGLELYGRRKDGSEFPIDIMLSTLQAEGESLALAVVRDVTQRKQAEVALRRSEEQFRSIVNSVEDYAIFLLDADGRITTWNPGAERIKGYRAEEIIGRDVESFTPRRMSPAASPAKPCAWLPV
jgi:PAS domain S-box-containing protein